MNTVAVEVPDRVRRKALTLGAAGVAWLAGLDDLVSDLAAEWGLSIGQALSGGTESFVAEARTVDGQGAVLKIALPGLDPTHGELHTLLAARGRGYAKIFRHDAARGAMLLERLGCRLEELSLPLDAQLEAICATLSEAWAASPNGARLTTGAEKAQRLAEFITTEWQNLGNPCPARVIDMACGFAELRCRAFNPATAVLAHGDPHGWNTLVVPGDGPQRFKFVDPDGLFIERAYDLGVLMREWGPELLAGDPLALGRRRCELLAELTGVAPEPIWQWGFIERTSSGLLLRELGLDDPAREFLSIAEAWTASV